MNTFRTIPEMLLNHAAKYDNVRAVNDRKRNAWHAVPMIELIRRIGRLASALDARLPVRGASIGVLSAPSSNWLVADQAIMLAGGVSIPFFVDFSTAHFKYKVADSAMKIIFVFGDALWERFRPFAALFDLVITDQQFENCSNAVPLDTLYNEGAQRLDSDPELLPNLLERVTPEDLAVVIYTSGSTGMPKGVELTHGNLAAQLHDIQGLFPVVPCEDCALSLLPVAHTFERTVIYLYLLEGMSVYFVDTVENIGALMKETRPSMITVVPRMLEKIHARIREKAAGIPGIKGRFAQWTFRRANRMFVENEPFSAANWIADRLVGYQVRKAFGGKLKTMVAGGTHMPEVLNHFFVRVGIPLFEGYGMTEASPVICVNYPGHRKVGTVGRPLASVEIKLSGTGEVWARGPNIMRGYRHREEETARVLDADGWLHTGDLGRIDQEGYLTIVARQKELFKTSTGEAVFPGPLENALCQSELVEIACIIAEARKYTSCLLFLSAAAASLDREFLSQQLEEHILQVNADLDHWEQIHGYALLMEIPSVENGLLTPTLKIRRNEIERYYEKLIDRLYDETLTLEGSDELTIGHC